MSLLRLTTLALLTWSSLSTAADRFILSGPTAYDWKTGLTWQRCVVGQTWDSYSSCRGAMRSYGWKQALTLYANGWQIPTKDELASLIDPERKRRRFLPKVDPVAFPGMDPSQPLNFWTSTPVANCLDVEHGNGCGFYVKFGNNTVEDISSSPKVFGCFVLLVSGTVGRSRESSNEPQPSTRSVSGNVRSISTSTRLVRRP